ncbi:uncharacterized protein LOC144714832 [Wolffia australiana]
MGTRVPTTQFISPVASSFVTGSLDNGKESTSVSEIHETCSDSLPMNGAASEDHSSLGCAQGDGDSCRYSSEFEVKRSPHQSGAQRHSSRDGGDGGRSGQGSYL